MIAFILFVFYLILFSYFVYRKTKESVIKIRILILIAFIYKVLFGCIYGKFYLSQIPNADTWNFFYNGLNLNRTHWDGVFTIKNAKNFNILSTDSYYNYYRYILMDMFSGVCSLLTGGRYYCNVIIFNFITFWGIFNFYKFLQDINPKYKLYFFIILFFFPPLAFWTSGFHRDGLCMAILGMYFYRIQLLIKTGKLRFILPIILCLATLLFLRSFWGFSAFFVGIIWGVSTIFNTSKPLMVFSLGVLCLITLFALSAFAPPNLNFAQSLIEKQHAFLSLKGDSQLPLTILSLNVASYCKAILDGVNHLMIRPYPKEIGHSLLYLFAFFENLFVWIFLGLAIYFGLTGKKRGVLSKPGNNALLIYVIINYAVVGLSVPFLGAIVRYKAPFEALLIILALQFIPLNFLRKLIPQRLRSRKVSN